jgi:hypothetical protein
MGSGRSNRSSIRRQTMSSGVEPSSWLATKCSTSPKRKNRLVTGSLTTKIVLLPVV